jgi:hypothetical protein
MLARLEASQARVDANLKKMKEEILAKTGANQTKTDATQERMNSNLKEERKSTVNTCQEKMDALLADKKRVETRGRRAKKRRRQFQRRWSQIKN